MITKDKIIQQLKKVIDPELNVNIVDLGLIYDVEVKPSKEKGFDVIIKMTLTSPGCPLSYVFEAWIPEAVKKVKGVKDVKMDLVWEPPWDPDKMTDEARESLGIIK